MMTGRFPRKQHLWFSDNLRGVGVRGQPNICRSSEKRVDILIRDFS